MYALYAPAGYDANGTGVVCYNAAKGSWTDDALVPTSISIQ